jgi:hypothetical protein
VPPVGVEPNNVEVGVFEQTVCGAEISLFKTGRSAAIANTFEKLPAQFPDDTIRLIHVGVKTGSAVID